MPLLLFKYIGSELHLTFDSIRRLVLHQLSPHDRRKALNHIEDCYRCRSIYESLAKPQIVMKRRSRKRHAPILLLGVLVIIGLSVSYLKIENFTNLSSDDLSKFYSWGLMKIKNEELSILPLQPPSVRLSEQLETNVANSLLKSIEPHYETVAVTKVQPVRSNEIHGIITSNDEPLQGVTIMVPDSKTARVSNVDGTYMIQVPDSAERLVFIYKGKHLSKELHTMQGRLDINLTTENMRYPEVGGPLTGEELIADN